jgi:transcription elongation GreA/GreB family factor
MVPASNLSHWKDVLKQLQEEELPKAKQRVGMAGIGGDWHENAEFEDAERQLEVIEVRIADIKRIIRVLELKSRVEADKSDKKAA